MLAGWLALVLLVGEPQGPRGYGGPVEVDWTAKPGRSGAAATDSSTGSPALGPVEPPAPRSALAEPPRHETIAVAVGLAPEAPGTKAEQTFLAQLERSAAASKSPPTTVRRLAPGVGDGRRICRQRRDDLVILIGYVPTREEPVVLAHDCRLDLALSLHATASVTDPELIGALWGEHEELVRQGAKSRRRLGRLSTKARVGIAAGVAVAVIGTALGLLVANALRDHRVVLKVAP